MVTLKPSLSERLRSASATIMCSHLHLMLVTRPSLICVAIQSNFSMPTSFALKGRKARWMRNWPLPLPKKSTANFGESR